MAEELRILCLEDDAADAELVIRQLRDTGLSFAWQRAAGREEFAAALAAFQPDLILADYRLPAFSGREALEMALAWRGDVPVIMVTGTLGDELAVDLLRAGAKDYVLKDHLARLGPAVRRALAERDAETERKRAERALEKANRALRTLSAGNEAMVRAVNEAAILRATCRAIVEAGGYPMAWVGYAQSDARRSIEPVAQIGFAQGHLEGLGLTWADGAENIAGLAIRTTAAQVARGDGGPASAGEAARLAIPFDLDSTRGVLCIHAHEADAFDAEEVLLLKELVDDLGYGITSLRMSAERVSAEQALHEGEMRFRRIVETAQEGIWMLDEAGRTTYMNRRMAEMVGAKADELLGTAAEDLIDVDHRAAFVEQLARLAELRPSPDRLEYGLRRRDGSAFWGSIALSAAREATGRCSGFLAMVTDVTEQRKLQEQLVISDRMATVGTLAASVAHEINNPLAGVVANLQLALAATPEEGGPPDAETAAGVREELRDALEAAERVRRITRDLKIFSGPRDEGTSPVDVQAVIESALRMAWNEIRHRARVVREYQPVPRVEGNESRLGQVFLNLIVNAAQAMAEGRAEENVIAVATRLDRKGRVLIEVRDTGSGMPPEVLRRLFTPFFTTKPVGKGTGLGLSICHRIVASMRGEIAAESAVGRGSVFRVALPVAQPEASLSVPPSERAPVTAPRRARLLVVDDEAFIGKTVSRVFAGEHDVTIETSARRALDRITRGESFDVILCDLLMPEVTGMDLHAEIRRSHPELAASIIFMTGGAFTPRARAFLDEVRGAWIDKPFDVADLKNAVNGRLRSGGPEGAGGVLA